MSIPEDIAPQTIRSRLTGQIVGRRLEAVEVIGSTNDAIMGAGQAGEPEGLAILADRQTSGRGRLGRSWASVPGVGIYTSILLRPSTPPVKAPLLTLMAGLAAAEAIEAVARFAPRLKWPNDLLFEGRKLSGILTEMSTMGQRISHVAIGIGINVHHRREDFPESIRETATSIGLITDRRVHRGELTAALYDALDRWYAVFCADGSAAILTETRMRSATLGGIVTVDPGPKQWQGMALDLDVDGALVVRDGAGVVRRVLAGDVSIR
jgi:BirA family biotin operon repressor/biotin-[acetyl-CoA-carboxylase] ligase